MKTVVLYPGRFQPMLPHHAEVYRHLQSQFPDAEVYIATSNKVEADKSPFNAEEKISIMTKQHDIPEDRILITKSPYNWKEYEKSFDSANTKLIFAIGGKDMEGNPRFSFKPKKDGSPSYLQMINTNSDNALPMNQSGYVYSAPTIGDANEAASASAFRTALLSAPALESAKEIYTRFMGEFNQEIFDLVYDKITGNIMKESIEILKKLAGLLDEAPINFKPGKGVLDYEPGISHKDKKASAERPDKAAASDPNTVGFTKIAPEDMISVDTGKPINSRQRARSMANQFPDGADVNEPAVKKEMFLKLLAQSPGYVLGEINARLANDDEGFAVSDRLSDIVDNLPEGGIMGLNDEDRKWTLQLLNNAINNMELHRKDASLDKFDDLESDEDPDEIGFLDPDGPGIGYVDDEEEDELEMEEGSKDLTQDELKQLRQTYGNNPEFINIVQQALQLPDITTMDQAIDYANEHFAEMEEGLNDMRKRAGLEEKEDEPDPKKEIEKADIKGKIGKKPKGHPPGPMMKMYGPFDRTELKKKLKKKMPKDLSGKSTKLRDFGKGIFKFDEDEYSKGDMVIVQGTPYILDTKEDDIWWASDQDGAEIEFHPGSEDHHEPSKSAALNRFGADINELRQLAGLQEGGECYHCNGEDEDCEYCQGTGYVTGEDDPNEPSQEEIDANYEIYKKHAEKGSQEENLDLSTVVESIVGKKRIEESAPYGPRSNEMEYEELLDYLGVTREQALMDLQDYYAPEQVHKNNIEEYEYRYRDDVLEPAADEISSKHAEPAEPEDEYEEESIKLDELEPSDVSFEPDNERLWIVVDSDGKEVAFGKMLPTNPPARILVAIPATKLTPGKISTSNGNLSIPNDFGLDIQRKKGNEPEQGELELPRPAPHQPELPNFATPQDEPEVEEDDDLEEGKLPAGLQAYQDKKNGKKDDKADKDDKDDKEVDEDKDEVDEVDEGASLKFKMNELRQLAGL